MDFHTNELIQGVGAQFDPEEFAATLQRAHVNSVTCFARCHHGWMYYDSKLFPDRIHPNLANKNLLKEQIEACHRLGIRVPVYTTIQWDHLTAREHPEWRVVTPEGKLMGTPPYEAGFYRHLCYNTPYRDFIKAHTRELLEMLPLDGLFFDIVNVRDCSCSYCLREMLEKGLDPTDQQVRIRFAKDLLQEFVADMSGLVWSIRPELSIYYNSGAVVPGMHEHVSGFSHLEFDVLPSSSPDGYMEFPVMTRFHRNLGRDCVGQTGKFHRSWGDFHSFKNQAALEYDCFYLLSQGCKLLIGDQLLPSGKIDPDVYDLVGAVYSQVEQKEPWCAGARPVVEIGVLSPQEFGYPLSACYGFVRMLEECAYQFDVIDSSMDFSRYKVLILPDCIPGTEALNQKIEAYLAQGGRLLASFESGMNPQKTGFTLPALGVECAGPGPIHSDGLPARGRVFERYDYADYILPRGDIGKGLPQTEHVMYTKCLDARPLPGSTVLADVILPEFYRSYQHFCSHAQAPSSGKVGSAAVVQNGSVIYFAHKIFDLYAEYAPRWVRQLFANALELLLPEPLVRHNGPSTLVATLTDQEQENRRVLHLLHYIPVRRAAKLEIIEDVIPVHDIQVSVRVPRRVARVACCPAGDSLAFTEQGETVTFTVPRVAGHQMVALEFAS